MFKVSTHAVFGFSSMVGSHAFAQNLSLLGCLKKIFISHSGSPVIASLRHSDFRACTKTADMSALTQLPTDLVV